MNDTLKKDVLYAINYLKKTECEFPSYLNAVDWDDLKSGVIHGMDDLGETAENLRDYINDILQGDAVSFTFASDNELLDIVSNLCDDLDTLEEGIFQNNKAFKERDDIDIREYTYTTTVREGDKKFEIYQKNDDENEWAACEYGVGVNNTPFKITPAQASGDEYISAVSYADDDTEYDEYDTDIQERFVVDDTDFVRDYDEDTDVDYLEESLNKLDSKTNNKYDLLNTFNSKRHTKKFVEQLRRKLRESISPKKLYEFMFDDEYEEDSEYELVASKNVEDYDGFMTEYSMYKSADGKYVFVFGDSELYSPEDGDFDWECDDEESAWEWFNNYNGAVEDDEYLEEDYYHDFSSLDENNEFECHSYYQRVNPRDYIGLEDDLITTDLIEAEDWVWSKVQHGLHVDMKTPEGEYRYFTPEMLIDGSDACSIEDVEEM